ncbi:MAG: hypothetical protein ACRDRA_05720 [Pseudonocardiaceae bacterium]
MSNRGPIITLLAVVALAAVLFLANTTRQSQTAGQNTGAPPPTPTSPVTTPPITAPPPEAAPQQATYTGRTGGNEATIAIAVQGDQAAAYVCDGRRVEAWLQGTISGDQLSLQGARGANATGTLEGDSIVGTVSLGGKQWPYSARLAGPPAGLYQGSGPVNGAPNRIGWIVLPDGSQVGVRNRNGIREPAPALDPQALRAVTVEGARIEPQKVTGGTQVVGVAGGPPA